MKILRFLRALFPSVVLLLAIVGNGLALDAAAPAAQLPLSMEAMPLEMSSIVPTETGIAGLQFASDTSLLRFDYRRNRFVTPIKMPGLATFSRVCYMPEQRQFVLGGFSYGAVGFGSYKYRLWKVGVDSTAAPEEFLLEGTASGLLIHSYVASRNGVFANTYTSGASARRLRYFDATGAAVGTSSEDGNLMNLTNAEVDPTDRYLVQMDDLGAVSVHTVNTTDPSHSVFFSGSVRVPITGLSSLNLKPMMSPSGDNFVLGTGHLFQVQPLVSLRQPTAASDGFEKSVWRHLPVGQPESIVKFAKNSSGNYYQTFPVNGLSGGLVPTGLEVIKIASVGAAGYLAVNRKVLPDTTTYQHPVLLDENFNAKLSGPLSPPLLVSAHAYGSPARVTFTWVSSTGAVSERIQWQANASLPWETVIDLPVDTAPNRQWAWVLPNAIPSFNYRIAAVGANGTETASDTRTFTAQKPYFSSLPQTPQDTLVERTVTLPSAPRFSSYHGVNPEDMSIELWASPLASVEFLNNPESQRLYQGKVKDWPAVNYTVPGTGEGYALYCRAEDGYGTSDWQLIHEARPRTLVTLSAPFYRLYFASGSSATASLEPAYGWIGYDNARYADLQISSNPEFTDPLLAEAVVQGSSFASFVPVQISPVLPTQTIFLRHRPRTPFATGEWSPTQEITRSYVTPQLQSVISQSIAGGVVLSWPSTDLNVTEYEVLKKSVAGTWVALATLPRLEQPMMTFTDTAAAPGVYTEYSINAKNPISNSTWAVGSSRAYLQGQNAVAVYSVTKKGPVERWFVPTDATQATKATKATQTESFLAVRDLSTGRYTLTKLGTEGKAKVFSKVNFADHGQPAQFDALEPGYAEVPYPKTTKPYQLRWHTDAPLGGDVVGRRTSSLGGLFSSAKLKSGMVLTLPTALTGYSHEWAMQPELVAPQLPGTARRHWVASSTWKYNAALTELANTTPAATSTRLEHGATAVSNWLLSKGYRPAVTPVPPAVAVPVGSKPAGTTGFAVFSHKFTSTERTWLEFPYTSQLPSFTTGKLTGTSLMVMDFDAMELYVIVTASAGRYKFYWIVASDEDDLETAIAGTDVENPTWLPSTTPGRTFYFSNEVSDSVPYTNSRSFNYSLNSAEYLPIPLFRGTQSLTAPLLMVEQNHNWLTGAIENPKIDDNYGVGFQQETVANTMTFSTSLTELVRGTNTHLARNGYYKIYAPGTKGHALAVVINYLDKKGYYDLTIFL